MPLLPHPIEIPLRCPIDGRNPLLDIDLEVEIADATGRTWRLPAAWDGDDRWFARFAPPAPGSYRWRASGELAAEPQAGTLEVVGTGSGLWGRGGVRLDADRRHLTWNDDGSPFFYLADTWWDGLASRFGDADLDQLARQRVAQGFTAVQVCVTTPPCMDPFDPRAANAGGLPFTVGYQGLTPAYFRAADARIRRIIDDGLVPGLVGAWGFLPWLAGERCVARLWRQIVARWAAWPVLWVLAGETTMPWYQRFDKEDERLALKRAWTGVARAVRACDGHRRVLATHVENQRSIDTQLEDPDLIDLALLQTGHRIHRDLPHLHRLLGEHDRRQPRLPFLVDEPAYEGVHGDCGPGQQRFQFWASLLGGGTVGWGYGADGIWQMNTETEFAGASPDGKGWGSFTWREAAAFPGAGHVGLGARFLAGLPWWRLEPLAAGLTPCWAGEPTPRPVAAHIPGELVLAYIDSSSVSAIDEVRLAGCFGDAAWVLTLFDPLTGRTHTCGRARIHDGAWRFADQPPPRMQDWVLRFARAPG